MNREEVLDTQLYEKMQSEYDTYLAGFSNMTPSNIVQNAYEIVYKQDILFCFEDADNGLNFEEKKALLSKKHPLEFLYQEWLASDCTHMEMLRDCIKDSVEKECKIINERKKMDRESR
jgi:GH35 family endo-1,4-beta-xylanase